MKVTLKLNLKNLIIANGYTITKFAELVGIRRQNMHRIIDGGGIDGATMLRVAELLNVDPREIWEVTPD